MKHINNIPESVVEIIKMIIEELRPSKIVLFGSRARGDHQPGSDIDLCLFGNHIDSNLIHLFLSKVLNKDLTLFKIDLLNSNDIKNEELKKNIMEEGLVIYERER